jgi:hypothetical protein
MSIKARLVACLGAALAPWLLAMPVPTEAADETLCSQANPTPPPCIPSTIIPLPDGQTLRFYHTSFVDPAIHTYVLAASATSAAGTGPSSNPRIIVVDTITNQVVNEFNANPTFAGSCSIPPARDPFIGPSGVILIEGSKDNRGQGNQGKGNQGKGNQGKGKVNEEIWASDGPIYTPSCAYPGNPGNISGTLTTPSSVKVIDLKTGYTKASISTGGQGRAYQLCYNPNSNVVLVANDNSLDNFITFIDAARYDVIGTISFAGSDRNSGPFSNGLRASGIGFCAFNPRDGKFYLNIPAVVTTPPSTNTQGYTLRISAAAPFTVEAAFQIPKTLGCTGGSGLAVGPANQLALACVAPSANSLIISDLFDGTAIPAGPGGVDEAWYNSGTNHYYYGGLPSPLVGVVDAGSTTNNSCNTTPVPSGCPTSDPSVPAVGFPHSVAADSVSNQVYVAERSSLFGVATVCGSFTGNTANDVQGCITVYYDPGEVPPGSN